MTVVHLPKHQNAGEVANAPQKIVAINDTHFSYSAGAKATKCDSYISAVHYNPEPHSLNRLAEVEAVKERDEDALKNDWHEEEQLSGEFNEHGPSFSNTLTEFQGTCDGHFGRINVANYCINLLNEEVRPFQSASY